MDTRPPQLPEPPLEAFLATVRPDARDTVRALAAAVEAAGAPFDQRLTYGMLVYTLDSRWHHWVVAIGVSSKAVNLRFLYGQRLDDPAGLLRHGSTTAAVIDLVSGDELDPALVTAYVQEAVAKHERS
jgi:hypothetical protein